MEIVSVIFAFSLTLLFSWLYRDGCWFYGTTCNIVTVVVDGSFDTLSRRYRSMLCVVYGVPNVMNGVS